ncbi:Hypp8751 [Branchiostoma lanceolatum]|uniref:Hypp8751 protein n=1 Tax=Branchiostoma lanceolatum TaxID=7740 RepID=A0A8K0EGI1_BRALA|nr:Hypp8751 [Branchiostoma lanceolatum]
MANSPLFLLLAVFCVGALAQGDLKEKPESDESILKRVESGGDESKTPGGEKDDSLGQKTNDTDYGLYGGGRDSTIGGMYGGDYGRDGYDYRKDRYADGSYRGGYDMGGGHSGSYDGYGNYRDAADKYLGGGGDYREGGEDYKKYTRAACPAGVPYVPYACADASPCLSAMCGDLDPNSPDSNITCVPTYCGGCHKVAFFNKTNGRPVKCTGEETGKCPMVPYGTVGTCAVQCGSDDDCKAVGSKCCSNGCGMTCQRAEPEIQKNFTKCRLYLTEEEEGGVMLWLFRPDNRGGKLFRTDPLGNGTYFGRFHGDRNELGAEVKDRYAESSDVVTVESMTWRVNGNDIELQEGEDAEFLRVAVCDCDDCQRKPMGQFRDGFDKDGDDFYWDRESFMDDFGKDRGSYGGDFRGDLGSMGGNFGGNRGSMGGNFGGNRGSMDENFGGDRGSFEGNFGGDRGSMGGNFGGDRGSFGGDQGSFGGNFGGDRGSMGGNFGGDQGSFEGNFGGNQGSFGGNFGGDRGSFEGNFGGDQGSFEGNFGGDRGSSGGNFEGDQGSFGGKFGGDRGSMDGNFGGESGRGSFEGNFGGDQGSSEDNFGGDQGSFGNNREGNQGSFGGNFDGDRDGFGGDRG